mgnify:CR=1 FL=1
MIGRALNAEQRHSLFLAFKEALSNVVQHSGATDLRLTIDARNQVDTLIYSVEKTLGESRASLDAGIASRTESTLEAARTAVKGDDKDAIARAGDQLQQASHAMAEAIYKAQTPPAGQGPQSGPEVKDAEVVDAEFAETK